MAPTTAVLGNNDYDEYGKNVTRFAYPVIDGVRFLVAHYPNDARIGFNGSRAIAPGDPLPQVCVHGHTHIPEILAGRDAYPASLFICPGSWRPTARRVPGVGRLHRAGSGRVTSCPRGIGSKVKCCWRWGSKEAMRPPNRAAACISATIPTETKRVDFARPGNGTLSFRAA